MEQVRPVMPQGKDVKGKNGPRGPSDMQQVRPRMAPERARDGPRRLGDPPIGRGIKFLIPFFEIDARRPADREHPLKQKRKNQSMGQAGPVMDAAAAGGSADMNKSGRGWPGDGPVVGR